MEIHHCPCCAGTNRKASLNVVDHMVSKEVFTVSLCSSCGCGITSPRPDEIGPYYESTAYTSHQDENGGLFGALYGWARAVAARQKVRLVGSAEQFRAAVARRALRATGLSRRLAAGALPVSA